jgi:very-short-patch-repair endonuclease
MLLMSTMAPRRYTAQLKEPARELRRDMTDTERLLWARLRRKQIANVQFYRQRPIDRFIVDFYAPAAKLVVELDGPYHDDATQALRDHERSVWLAAEGFQVLRFTNDEVSADLDHVVERILEVVLSAQSSL